MGPCVRRDDEMAVSKLSRTKAVDTFDTNTKLASHRGKSGGVSINDGGAANLEKEAR
jgi:hypothetical protein